MRSMVLVNTPWLHRGQGVFRAPFGRSRVVAMLTCAIRSAPDATGTGPRCVGALPTIDNGSLDA